MRIGIIAEGSTDISAIENVIELLVPGCEFRQIQPDISATARNYNGWKGVWQWCIKDSNFLLTELNKIPESKIDLFVIHLDGDTIREKNLHCKNPEHCYINEVSISSAAYCGKSEAQCPLKINQEIIDSSLNDKVCFLATQIQSWLNEDFVSNVVLCLPFDSTESWIVAAFDKNEHGDPEMIIKPADTIIGHSAYYHGQRVKRKDGKLEKKLLLYDNFLLPKLCDQWNYVTSICQTAKNFEVDILSKLGNT